MKANREDFQYLKASFWGGLHGSIKNSDNRAGVYPDGSGEAVLEALYRGLSALIAFLAAFLGLRCRLL